MSTEIYIQYLNINIEKIMSSTEQIIAWDLSNKHKWSFPYDRVTFYDEQIVEFKNHWSPTLWVSVIGILIFNESGEIIVQKRAKHKNHNAWLLDKTVWWHVKYWDGIDYTVMVETVEELQCPSIVVKHDENFEERLKLLKNYIKTLAIISHIDVSDVIMERKMKDGNIRIANKMYLYFGVYWWRVKNVDKEAMWILYYSLDDLLNEIQEYPNMFTYDLKYILETHNEDIRSFIDLIKNTI